MVDNMITPEAEIIINNKCKNTADVQIYCVKAMTLPYEQLILKIIIHSIIHKMPHRSGPWPPIP